MYTNDGFEMDPATGCGAEQHSFIHSYYLHLQILSRYKDISSGKYRPGSKNSESERKNHQFRLCLKSLK